MNQIIDSIRVETHTLRWNNEQDPDKVFLAKIAFLDTEEQGHQMSEGIMDNDPEWMDFDDQIFYWITAFQGENISDHYPDNNPRMDFVVIPEKERVNE